jgi:ABC-2 type transport system permease protein
MSASRVTALFRHNLRLLAADPAPVLVTTLMPLVLMAFLQGMGRAVLEAEGYTDVSGAEHVVPGMAVLFSLFGVTYLGVAFFQEHGWGTWQRLRASPAFSIEIMLGKLLPSALVILLQLAVLFGAGVLLFGLRPTGTVPALVVMLLASTAFLVALSMLCVALLRTINQLAAIVNVGAMVLGGLGGALAPPSAMPAWAQAVAPASPAYWALDGFRTVILEGGGVTAVVRPAAVLCGLAVLAAVIAMARFRFADEKAWNV